ncbi:MAG: RES family NAD+ phosphorylase [Cyclobacteriaceae bacterium]|nr:RES family NAD+ phosphorylase [Cyclobacteriaceae bacterium]
MLVYRIEKQKYKDTFPPMGSLLHPARWHNEGTWVVYTAENIALAKLEDLANSTILPKNRYLRTIQLEENAPVYVLKEEYLPDNWNRFPIPAANSTIIKRIIKEGKYVAASVPSVQSPRERNYLLFPGHKDFSRYVSSLSVEKIDYDRRLKPS